MVYWCHKCEGAVCVGDVGHKMGDLRDVGIEELRERSKESIELVEPAELRKNENDSKDSITL